MRNTLTVRARTVLLSLLFAAISSLPTYADDAVQTYDIKAQPMDQALKTFATQTEIQVAFSPDTVEGLMAAEVQGDFPPESALQNLIDDTGLYYEFASDKLVVVSAPQDEEGTDVEPGKSQPASSQVLMAQNQTPATQSQTANPNNNTSKKDDQPIELEEIIVTGTSIRGTNSGSSPVISFDRETIDSTGFSQADQLIRSLPQNFGGGPTQFTATSGNVTREAVSNNSNGSGANLRGLGADSTLVLIDSRRIAPSGGDGDFVDLSLIPFSALERVEVLTDGASAVYGSDAIGGVINFLLRNNYEGAETRLRYGTVTAGSMDELQFGQTLGKSWGRGNALISYEYYKRSNLRSSERSFVANSDLSEFGGDNFSRLGGSPGTITNFFTGQTTAIPPGQDGTSLTPNDFTLDTANLANSREGTDLLAEQERHSVFTVFSQELSENVTFFAQGRYNTREFTQIRAPETQTLFVTPANPFFVDPFGGSFFYVLDYTFENEFGNVISTGETENYGGTVGLEFELASSWSAELFGTYSLTDTTSSSGTLVSVGALNAALNDPNPATAFNPFGDGTGNNQLTVDLIGVGFDFFSETSLWSINGLINGDLLDMSGGTMKVAAGFEYRKEELSNDSLTRPIVGDSTFLAESALDRDVTAGFVEFYVPLVGEGNRMAGVTSLELTVAGRFESYSDFGDTFNPKAGIRWGLNDSFAIRGSYGTSFKAPLLIELDDQNQFRNAVFYSTNPVPRLARVGNNSDLQPEEAKTLSLGLQVSPQNIKALSFEANYFVIDFEDRIDIGGNNAVVALNNRDIFGSLITDNPSNELVNEIVNGIGYNGPPISGTDPQTGQVLINGIPVEAVVDLRLRNLSNTKVEGFDFSARYGFDTDIGRFDLAVLGSVLTKFDKQLLPTTPVNDVLDTVGNPLKFRMRDSVTWTGNGGLSATVFLNYAEGYTDNISVPERSVDSFTTIDLQVRYDTEDRLEGFGNNTVIALSVQNLFDENPPFVNNPIGVGYDDQNASPMGRFVALQVTKSF